MVWGGVRNHEGISSSTIQTVGVVGYYYTGWPKMNEWVLIRYNFLFKT